MLYPLGHPPAIVTRDTGIFGQEILRPATGNRQGGLIHEPGAGFTTALILGNAASVPEPVDLFAWAAGYCVFRHRPVRRKMAT
jgi:hypothetical protein